MSAMTYLDLWSHSGLCLKKWDNFIFSCFQEKVCDSNEVNLLQTRLILEIWNLCTPNKY